MSVLRLIVILVVFIFYYIKVYCQKTLIYTEPYAEYRLALELFNKEKFGAAQKSFDNVVKMLKGSGSEIETNSKFYSAICALELFHEDAEYKLIDFINKNPDHSKVKLAYFYLGKHYFRKKNYKKTNEWFEKVDVYDLTNAEISEYYFKNGYAYFMQDDYEKAKKNFYEVKELDNVYGPPSKYYYSHIAYSQKNYETALQGFLALQGNSMFGSIVPYYITQLYYLQGNFEKVVSYAPRLLDSANVQKVAEISKIVAESYFKMQKYKEAIPFFERYRKQTSVPLEREDIYKIGYSYFRAQQYDKAIEYFSKVQSENDFITQAAYYNAAVSYLNLGQKDYARNSFLAASKLEADKKIQEDALLNYAKLAYELSYNPYNEAINAFHRYIKTYPNSPHLNEIYEYLYNIYMSTKNYKDALASIEKLDMTDIRLKMAYQKIAFFRGIELYNDKAYNAAITHFNKSLKYPIDNDLTAKTHYWKADAFYKLEKYDSSIASYKNFSLSPGAINQPFYNLFNYNIAYCYFNKKQYSEANIWFRKYLVNTSNEKAELVNDALLRTADCYYMQKDYDAAIDYYTRASELGKLDTDYALYQKAMAYGLNGKQEEKINTLTKLITNYPGSNHQPEAKFELGKTYQQIGKDSLAIISFDKVINEHPNSSYAKKAMLRKGLIYRNNDKYDDALVIFKNIISQYPGTEESKEALQSIKNIYVDKNEVEEFFKFVKNMNYSDISETSQDTLYYIAAENKYMDGDCEGASKGFKTYLERFPQGAFTLQANFYKAECNMKNKQYDEALKSYIYIITKPNNKFTEQSLLNASKICMQKKEYSQAKTYFYKLENSSEYPSNVIEARYGIMKTSFLLYEYQEAITYAQKLLSTEKLSKSMQEEARMILGKSYYALNDYTSALGEFQIIAKFAKNENAAEAQYNIAEIYYKQSLYDQAEKEVFALINQVPSYDHWVAKGFILLADIYVAKGNTFQAKHTLQSIIDNHEGPELVKIAQEKLNKILIQEQQTEKKKAQEEIMIQFNKDAELNEIFQKTSEPEPINPEIKNNTNQHSILKPEPQNISDPQKENNTEQNEIKEIKEKTNEIIKEIEPIKLNENNNTNENQNSDENK